ncbi:UDP-N-acetylmuramoyl-tripeptide--D-alanyl-D-alanine ligase [Patescibacteria group bacterium]|nr:UDP-N-acetylmuramoyl-tripeptide--D-alanyl-D-alanine ligase [Patescibacteria group bacterium]
MANFFPLSIFLSLFWFISKTKIFLFYLYLWQLKEYHIGRFRAHFQTEKGKELIFNPLIFLKIVLILIFFIFPASLPILLLFLYFIESSQAFRNFLQKKLKKPVLTKKTTLLILVILFFEIFFLFTLFFNIKNITRFAFWLLVFDILTPLIASLIVLLLQPLTVLARWHIIQKAKKKREKFKDLIVVGITGSFGKTSTKEFLATILEEKFSPSIRQKTNYGGSAVASGEGGKVLKTFGHQNSEIGISQCILNDLKPEHQIFIVEMGAYNRGGIKLLCDITKPKIGILTGINEQHLATFGSQENIIKTKYELIESLPGDGLAIFNGNNKYCVQLYQKTKIPKKIYRSTFPTIVENTLQGDIWTEEIKVEKDSLSFKVFSNDGDWANFKVNLLGAQNAPNLLAAICVAKELGMSFQEISKACQKIKPWQGGVKLLKARLPARQGKNGLNIIDSTYSTNPDGVIYHLEYLKIWKGKKIIVMPCLIELGKTTIEVHKRIGERIGQVCNLAIITTKERFKEIKEEAVKSGISEENILFLKDPRAIFEKIKIFIEGDLSSEARRAKEDVILLESRVPNQLINLLIE